MSSWIEIRNYESSMNSCFLGPCWDPVFQFLVCCSQLDFDLFMKELNISFTGKCMIRLSLSCTCTSLFTQWLRLFCKPIRNISWPHWDSSCSCLQGYRDLKLIDLDFMLKSLIIGHILVLWWRISDTGWFGVNCVSNSHLDTLISAANLCCWTKNIPRSPQIIFLTLPALSDHR